MGGELKGANLEYGHSDREKLGFVSINMTGVAKPIKTIVINFLWSQKHII